MPRPTPAPGDRHLERALADATEGEVRFDALTRGIYSTDASHYRIEPLGVVFPRSVEDVQAVLRVARESGVSVLPRGGGTSQCGQTVGRSIVLDTTHHLSEIGTVGHGELPPDQIEVGPGVVLDHLNRELRENGLWFPVDPSTGSRATLGGMAGNNSAGARSLKYGMMVDNVEAIEAVLVDGRRVWLGADGMPPSVSNEVARLRELHTHNADEIVRRTPKTRRNVAGYSVERLAPGKENFGQLLVGSEGTLAFFSRLRLRLRPLPRTRVLGVCHFAGLIPALEAVQHIVELGPTAVELVDDNVLTLAAGHPDFGPAMERFVRGSPRALLLVEFEDEQPGGDLTPSLRALEELLGELGHPDSVVHAVDPGLQAAVWSVRKAGLNIVMSMAGPRKPISFIEDCAVPLQHLGTYARRVNEIFARHGAEGTWYAHASVGCLHVRPALDLRRPAEVRRMRAIAEETHAVVRELEGTHSGEHGDGLLRSEFIEPMLGTRMTRLFGEVKRTFDPAGIMNPGKIVDPPRMDDRTLFRLAPGYRAKALPVVLDWSADGGFLQSLEKCNNNGACRKSDPGVMCPSFRATGEERHSTRGRANALRLAVTGELGEDALDSPEMADAMSLCIGCKGCKRECPTGVDMTRLKLEWQHGLNGRQGVKPRERALAALPRLAPWISKWGSIANTVTGTRRFKRMAGLATARSLPQWSREPWNDAEVGVHRALYPDAVLFVDTFSRWFEPEVPRAATEVLAAGGWSLGAPDPADRPLCCGRTYLSAGMIDEARVEADRLVAALAPAAEAGSWIVGLEPSCLLTLRDEIPSLVPGADADRVAAQAVLLEEFLDAAWERGETLPLGVSGTSRALVHGHCHQKAFGADQPLLRMLERVAGLDVEAVPAGCCGMAGAFGYHTEHYSMSMAIGELDLLPTLREASSGTLVVADGTSCRAQIREGSGREAVHAAIVLRDALG